MFKGSSKPLSLIVVGFVCAFTLSACGGNPPEVAKDTDSEVVIGVLAVSEGNLAFAMGESKRAIGVAMSEYGGNGQGGEIAGKKIKFVYKGTDGTSRTAQTKVKELIQTDGVDLVFGPSSGDEGEAVVQYAIATPQITFITAPSAPIDLTLQNAKNVYRFNGDAAMWMSGVGEYAYREKGYKKIYLVAEDYSFPYDNAGGFFSEFCAAGGQITGTSWVPVGTKNYQDILDKIPSDSDAIYVGLGGGDVAKFLGQATKFGLKKPLVGGSIAADVAALSDNPTLIKAAQGMITGGPIPGSNFDSLNWKKFTSSYAQQPNAFPSPSLFSALPYNSISPLLQAIEKTKGNFGEDQKDLRTALSRTDWQSPTGRVTVDKNNQAVVDNFIVEVQKNDSGELALNNSRTVKQVRQSEKIYNRFTSCP